MGIDTHVFAVYGIKDEWNEEFHNAHMERDDEIINSIGYDQWRKGGNDLDQVEIISDGMSCEYIVYGVHLYDSGNWRWGELEGEKQTDINDGSLEKMREKYLADFKRIYPDFYHLVDKPWKLIHFVHYS